MSNPARAPKEPTLTQLMLSVAPDAFLPEGFAEKARRYKKVEAALEALAGLDMPLEKSFVIPRELTVDARVHNSSRPTLATAKIGVPTARVRSELAKRVVGRAFAHLPEEGLFSKGQVGDAMRKRVFVDAGTEGALGRIAAAYPKVGWVPRQPITTAEAEAAVVRCGLDMGGLPGPALYPFPLVARPGEVSVTVNPKSDNGFPVLGQWSTAGAAQRCKELAVAVRQELERTSDVEGWLRQAEAERPWLVALRGKAKGDYYAQEKVVEARMRFYNAFPRQIMMNMQRATQVLEQNSSHAVVGRGHSAIGMTLVRGGAQELVEVLEKQLVDNGWAYVHVGDDSWVVLKRGDRIVFFALDCSNFDLTQHGTVTKEVHAAICRQLELIDRPAARLWHAYARERVVVVTGAMARRFKHAGPSGMPLQSKVNDVLMDVMITRLLARLDAAKDVVEMGVALAVQQVAADMGFVARLEQFWCGRADTVIEALEQCPFLFIGYYFHVRGGEVRVCADVPRTFAQVPYPSLKWLKTGKELAASEAMRLGSIALGLGLPPVGLDEAFEAFRSACVEVLDTVLATFGDSNDERLQWAVQNGAFGPEVEPSLMGLRRALGRNPAELWRKESPLPSVSLLVPVSYTQWADLAEEEEQADARAAGVSLARPRADTTVRAARLPAGRATTHAATVSNAGRPPPTAVWGPDRAPRERPERMSARTRRRDGIAAREFHQALEEAEDLVWSDELE